MIWIISLRERQMEQGQGLYFLCIRQFDFSLFASRGIVRHPLP